MSGRLGQRSAAALQRRVRTLNQALHLWPVAKERDLALHSLCVDYQHHVLCSATSAARFAVAAARSRAAGRTRTVRCGCDQLTMV